MIRDSSLSLYQYNGAVVGSLMIIWGIFALNGAYWDTLVSWNVWLEGAHFYIAMVPFSVLDLCGSLIVCIYYRNDLSSRNIYRGTLESFVACCLMQFGGTSLTAVFLLGQTPSWLLSHTAFNSFLLAWWLIFFSPADQFYTFLSKSHTITIPLISIGAACSSGHACTSWGVDKAVYNTFHVNYERLSQSIWPALLCGTFSSCGGTLLKDWFNMLDFPSFTIARPPVLFEVERRGSPPGSPAKNVGFMDGTSRPDDVDALLLMKQQQQGLLTKSFLLATVYYCLSDPSGYVKQSLLRPVYNVLDGVVPPIFLPLVHTLDGWERTDACLLIVLCQVTHYVYKVFAPTAGDLTLPCMRAFCSVTNIASTVPINRTM